MIFILPVQKLLKAFLRDSFSISDRDELKEMLILLTIQDAIYLISGDSQLSGHFRHSESSGLHFRVPLFILLRAVSGLSVIPFLKCSSWYTFPVVHNHDFDIIPLDQVINDTICKLQHFCKFRNRIRPFFQFLSRFFSVDFMIFNLIRIPLFKTLNIDPHLSGNLFGLKKVFMYQPIPIRLFKPQELAHLRNTHPFLFRRRQPLVWAVCFHFLYQFFVFLGIHFSLLIHEAFLLLPIPYRTFSKKFRVLNASGIRLAPTEAERRVDFSSG